MIAWGTLCLLLAALGFPLLLVAAFGPVQFLLGNLDQSTHQLANPVVVKDNALAHTSAWANSLLARDHQAKDGEFSG